MIVDAFAFFNELELLELRLHTLNDVVDIFYLVECPYTFTCLPKPLYFEENKDRPQFKPFLHKIKHIILDEKPPQSISNPQTLHDKQLNAWEADHWQKNHLEEALDLIDNNDILMFGDLDELPNPFVCKEIINQGTLPAVLLQTLHFYYINWVRPSTENGSYQKEGYIYGTVLISKQDFYNRNYNIKKLRADRFNFYQVPVERGGWHYCSLGGADRVAQKTKSWAHVEVDCHGDLESTKLAVQKAHDLSCDAYLNDIKMTVYPFIPERHPPYMGKLLSKYPYLANFNKS